MSAFDPYFRPGPPFISVSSVSMRHFQLRWATVFFFLLKEEELFSPSSELREVSALLLPFQPVHFLPEPEWAPLFPPVPTDEPHATLLRTPPGDFFVRLSHFNRPPPLWVASYRCLPDYVPNESAANPIRRATVGPTRALFLPLLTIKTSGRCLPRGPSHLSCPYAVAFVVSAAGPNCFF